MWLVCASRQYSEVWLRIFRYVCWIVKLGDDAIRSKKVFFDAVQFLSSSWQNKTGKKSQEIEKCEAYFSLSDGSNGIYVCIYPTLVFCFWFSILCVFVVFYSLRSAHSKKWLLFLFFMCVCIRLYIV